jgi:mersacidin/lichenicidin family type 2 lantibiotic
MSQENMIRAWKDEIFRNSLSAKERASLPENPAGLVELTDVQMGVIAGGRYGFCTQGSNCTLSGCTE